MKAILVALFLVIVVVMYIDLAATQENGTTIMKEEMTTKMTGNAEGEKTTIKASSAVSIQLSLATALLTLVSTFVTRRLNF
jgi:hypothetical protein